MKKVIIAYRNFEDRLITKCQVYANNHEYDVIGIIPMNEALQYCTTNQVDMVIVHSVGELIVPNILRDALDAYHRHDIKIHCVREGIQLLDGSTNGQFVLTMISNVLEILKEQRSARIKAGIKARKQRLQSDKQII